MIIAKRLGSSTITNYIFSFFDIVSVVVQFVSSLIILCTYSFGLLLMALLGAMPEIFTRKFANRYEDFNKKHLLYVE